MASVQTDCANCMMYLSTHVSATQRALAVQPIHQPMERCTMPSFFLAILLLI